MTLFPLLESRLLNISILLYKLGGLNILQRVAIHHCIRIFLNYEQGLVIIAVTISRITIPVVHFLIFRPFIRSARFTVQNIVIHSRILYDFFLLLLVIPQFEEKLLSVSSAMGSISSPYSILY